MQDVAPRLDLNVAKDAKRILVRCNLSGATARDFARQRGDVLLFVDGRLHTKIRAREVSFDLSFGTTDLSSGAHIVAVNWVTPNGPTAASAARILID